MRTSLHAMTQCGVRPSACVACPPLTARLCWMAGVGRAPWPSCERTIDEGASDPGIPVTPLLELCRGEGRSVKKKYTVEPMYLNLCGSQKSAFPNSRLRSLTFSSLILLKTYLNLFLPQLESDSLCYIEVQGLHCSKTTTVYLFLFDWARWKQGFSWLE